MNRTVRRLIAPTMLLLLSCDAKHAATDPYEYEPPVFKREYRAEIIPLNRELMFGLPRRILLCDSAIVLQATSIDNDNVFQVLSAADGKVAGSFAHIGRGNAELEDYGRLAADAKNKALYAMSNRGKFMKIDLRRALAGDPRSVEYTYNFPNRNTTLEIHCAGDRILHTEARPRFFLTDMTGYDTLARCDDYPQITPQLDRDTTKAKLYFSYCSTSAIRPHGKKFVSMTNFGMLMEIFDIAPDKIELAAIRRFHRPHMAATNYGTDDCIRGAFVQSVTDEYIYAIYYDVTYGRFKKGALPCIAVFDWDGREVCRYRSDDHIICLAVTPDDRKAYCWVRNSRLEEYIGCFDLRHD